jgi:prepilin-type N-terminal cleavage/methylation domain-containing protein
LGQVQSHAEFKNKKLSLEALVGGKSKTFLKPRRLTVDIKQQRGFTLIEVLVVIITSGILMLILWKFWFVGYVQVIDVRNKNGLEQDLEVSLFKFQKSFEGFKEWTTLEQGLLVWSSERNNTFAQDSLDFRYLEEDSLVYLNGKPLWQKVNSLSMDFWTVVKSDVGLEDGREYQIEKSSLREVNIDIDRIVGLETRFSYGEYNRRFEVFVDLRESN